MKREPGFYWVKKSLHLDFSIAYFDGEMWAFSRDSNWCHESMIHEIDNRRIVREEPSK